MTFNPSIANITQLYRNLTGLPYVTVSRKGVRNQLSNTYNDGAMFGPDTTLNATSPDQVGPPYTQTSGIQEAHNYLPDGGEMRLGNGDFYIYDTINISNDNIVITGAGMQGYIAGQLAPESGTRIVLGNNVNNTMINVTGSKYIFQNFDLNGNSPNNTTSGLYGILANPGNIGQDLHLNNMYVIQVNGIGVYSNAVFFADTLITEGNSSWGLYLTGTIDGAVNNYISFDDAGGAYFGGSNFVASNVIVLGSGSGFGTLPEIEIAGNYNNLVNLIVERVLTTSTPVAPLQISGSGNTISNVQLQLNTANVTTYPPSILITGEHNQIDNITNNVSLPNNFLQFESSGFNHVTNVTGLFNSATNIIADSGFGGNLIDGLQLFVNLSFPYSINTSVTTDYIRNVVLSNYQSGAIIPLPQSTPAMPASGTAQSNTTPFMQEVYIYGGTVTEIQITKLDGGTYTVFSNATGLALSGQVYRLDPMDSITVTYTTAPTWTWLPA